MYIHTHMKTRKFLEMIDMFSILDEVTVSQVRHISKLIKMGTLNVYNILSINYTSIKLKTIELNISFLVVVYLDSKLKKGRVTLLILLYYI